MNKEKINKYFELYSPIAFIFLTLLVVFLRIPFYDETHALIISQLNLSEIFQLSRIEGHPILWYLILKPFSSLNLYPYSMALINWVFASLMVVLFWKKAPFNNYIKFLLTFSYPFFQYFGMVSRPYTLGVLIIFLLCSFYKDSTKKPIIYSSLLVLCANISVITAFIAFGFGVLFLFEVFKNKISKKDLTAISLIFITGFLLLCSQFLFLETPKMQPAESHTMFLKHLSYFIFAPFADFKNKNLNQVALQLVSSISFFYFSFLFFKAAKKSFFLFFLSVIPMILLFALIYIGDFWHYYLIFIVFISALWINWDKLKNNKIANILVVLLVLLNMTSYSITQNGKNRINQPIFYKKTLDIVLNSKDYKDSKLFCFNHYSHLAPGLLLYLKKEGISLYDNHNNDRTSFSAIRNIQNMEYKALRLDEFLKYLSKDKNNYLLATSNKTVDYQNFSYSEGNKTIYFDLVEKHPEIYLLIYKIRYEIR